MRKFVYVLFAAAILMSCEKKDMDLNSNSDMDLKSGKSKLDLSFDGLSPLGADFRYEGWLIVDGVAISTGKFNITPSGQMSPRVFNVKKDYIENAAMFVLSIEPQPDSDPGPSSTKVLGGVFSDGIANLSISHPAALGTDFESSMGKYILATPTNGSDTDEKSGIWFLDLSTGSPLEGLDLPTLPDGWIYEGWTVINGIPVTSGKFMSTSGMVDKFDGYSSMEYQGPPFPGEDYLMNAPKGLNFPTDISGGFAVISVEPYPDNGPEPFAIKPLAGMIPDDAMDHVTYSIGTNPASFPTGIVNK